MILCLARYEVQLWINKWLWGEIENYTGKFTKEALFPVFGIETRPYSEVYAVIHKNGDYFRKVHL
jgi:hypothetical protein